MKRLLQLRLIETPHLPLLPALAAAIYAPYKRKTEVAPVIWRNVGTLFRVGVLALLSVPSTAQTAAKPPAKRVILQRADVATSPQQKTIMATIEVAPRSGNPFHTHFGTEMAYVVAGHIRLEIKGAPTRELGPGDSFLVQRGQVHRSVPIGDEVVKLVNTWTVDKGKALLTPAAEQ